MKIMVFLETALSIDIFNIVTSSFKRRYMKNVKPFLLERYSTNEQFSSLFSTNWGD